MQDCVLRRNLESLAQNALAFGVAALRPVEISQIHISGNKKTIAALISFLGPAEIASIQWRRAAEHDDPLRVRLKLQDEFGESQLIRSLFPMVAKAAEFFRTRDNFLCVSAA
jgi:hypothetical protein